MSDCLWHITYELRQYLGDEPENHFTLGTFSCEAHAPYCIEWEHDWKTFHAFQEIVREDAKHREEYQDAVRAGAISEEIETMFRQYQASVMEAMALSTDPPELDPLYRTTFQNWVFNAGAARELDTLIVEATCEELSLEQ